MTLQLWDTAGDEKYHSVIPIYIKDSSIAVVVYDITDSSTFDSVQRWVEQIREIRGEQAAIYLVANKADLKEQRKVQQDAIEKKCAELSISNAYEVSAKTGEGVKELLTHITDTLYTQTIQEVVE